MKKFYTDNVALYQNWRSSKHFIPIGNALQWHSNKQVKNKFAIHNPFILIKTLQYF